MKGLNVRRPRYRELEFKILEILATKADSGILPRPAIQKECRMPKSSMSDVLKDMESRNLVKRMAWFRNQERIAITEEGRAEYARLRTERLKFPMPYPVQRYLSRREPKVTDLFPIQQSFVDRGLLHVANNACVFGYPGSGKTLVAEMAMANELDNNGKVLYCTPYKALDWQKYYDFSRWFSDGLKAKVVITDGDNPIGATELLDARIVIATYERVLGAIQSAERWIWDITLVCADEITLFDDQSRGGTIDLVLTHFKSREKPPRIITLSSLVGNPLQISEWANAEPVVENRPLPGIRIEEYLAYRCGDEIVFLGRDGRRCVQKSTKDIIEHVVEQNLKKEETTLIFVGSRPETQQLAGRLRHYHKYDRQLASRAMDFFEKEIWEKTKLTKELCDLIGYGVAFHHAGIQRKARRFVEDLMRENLLKTIVATTTLSHGVDYSIDNVIIDLPAILRVHELHGYEYINLKGRTGRFGKSKSASVYILTEKKQAEDAFTKYFLGSPEPVLPSSTLAEGVIATTILLEAERSAVSPQRIADFLSKTLCAKQGKVGSSSLRKIMEKLTEFGFLIRRKREYAITELGKKVNAANLSPHDARLVLSLSSSLSDKELIDIASNIDLARRVRERSKDFFMDPVVDILMDWIEEMPIDSIKAKHGSYYNDHDIVELGEYTSSSLRKISLLVSDEKLKGRIDTLQERVKFGIKTDLVKSGLMRLPSLLHDKKRQLARSIFNSGLKDMLSLAKQQPESLTKKLNISKELAARIIADAKDKVGC
jgi:replicative superfamily II helicase